MVMSPNILEVMSFRMSTRVTATVVYCILMQILCVVSQKGSASGGLRPPHPLPGLRPWTPMGNLSPPIILWDRCPCVRSKITVISSKPNWRTFKVTRNSAFTKTDVTAGHDINVVHFVVWSQRILQLAAHQTVFGCLWRHWGSWVLYLFSLFLSLSLSWQRGCCWKDAVAMQVTIV